MGTCLFLPSFAPLLFYPNVTLNSGKMEREWIRQDCCKMCQCLVKCVMYHRNVKLALKSLEKMAYFINCTPMKDKMIKFL